MDSQRKVHKQLLAFSRYTIFYIPKLYFYVFINVRGSRLFSNPVTYILKVTRYTREGAFLKCIIMKLRIP